MGYRLSASAMDAVLAQWSKTHDVYAPKNFEGTGRFSETDVIRYGVVTKSDEIVWDKRSEFLQGRAASGLPGPVLLHGR